MATRIGDLLQDLVKATGLHQDHRFDPWAKKVKAVDAQLDNGYCFVGGFIKEGTVEYPLERTIYVVMTSQGSRNYQVKHYTVVVMDENGQFALPGLHTTGEKPGWALRLREGVQRLLADKPEVVPDYQI